MLRWEYRPGSTLFLVWSHGQNNFTPDPRRSLSGALGDLINDTQRNTFLVKASYWISL